MRNLEKYGNLCIQELKELGIPTEKIPKIIWKVNNAKRTLGRCRYSYKTGKTEIFISSFMLDENIVKDETQLKTVIMHELLHSIVPQDGHRGKWKEYANLVTKNSNGKYIIKRTTSYEEVGVDQQTIQKPKYVVLCEKCGNKFYRNRKSKLVSHPERFRCACGGNLKAVIL